MEQKHQIKIDLGSPCFLSSKELTNIGKYSGKNQMEYFFKTLGQPSMDTL